jgi:type I restriction enzyme M protein
MKWIAPPERDSATHSLEARLWEAADQLRANSNLNSQQYSQPVLGLIFLRFAGVRFNARRNELEKVKSSSRRGSRSSISDAQTLPSLRAITARTSSRVMPAKL